MTFIDASYLTHFVATQFTDALKAKEQEEREARLSKLRPALRNMLKGNPNVFHYTTFATADKLFSQHPIWQQSKVEAERRLIFEEYVAELKQREVVRANPSFGLYRNADRLSTYCSRIADSKKPELLVAAVSPKWSLYSSNWKSTLLQDGELPTRSF
jgi:hypothetical protein